LPANAISLLSLFWTFLKVGATAFGGFMALISVVQNLVVERRRLLRQEEMLDGISLASMLPGPVAVNVVAYVGYRLRGVVGALVAATAVILPSFILITALSYVYFRWGQIPAMQKLFMGFVPAVTAIIASTAWGMSLKTIGTLREMAILFVSAFVLLNVGGFYSTVAVIVFAAVAGYWLFRADVDVPGTSADSTIGKSTGAGPKLSFLALTPIALSPFAGFPAGILAKLFLTFAGMSVMLFGGGYVFIPMIQEAVVDGQRWVTQTEFIDAIALGQVTPGPILISAAFIGYKVAGVAGAAVSTVGIFAPPAVIMLIATSMLDRVKTSKAVQAGLRGVRPAVIGMIFAAAVVIGSNANEHWLSLLIFSAALLAILRFRVEVVWIIPASGLLGLVLY